MNILLLTAYFPPDTGSAAHLFYELGVALTREGHMVSVLTSFPSYHAQGDLRRYRGRLWMVEEVDGIRVARVVAPNLPRHIPFARGIWQFSLAMAFALGGMRLPRQDVALVYSPPLPLGLTAWWLKFSRKVPFVLNVQDLFPQSVIDLGILRNRWLIRFFEGMERFVYRQADHITVHSPGNRDHVVGKGAPLNRVTVVPNWVDTEFIHPGERHNGFSREHNLDDKFVVSFAGILGYSQDLDVVLEAAKLLHRYSDIQFLIVGDGVEKPRLERKAVEMGLRNVRFVPMQPRHRYPEVLNASDVCLATLHAEVRTPVVPSKMLGIMAAARPVVAAMNLDGDAPRLIEAAQCGLVVPPEDSQALAEAVLALYNNETLRVSLGQNGRRYAEEHLSLKVAARRYIAIFTQIVQ